MGYSYNIAINSLILLSSMLLNGVILTFKRENVRIAGAEWVHGLERQKALEGLFKIVNY